MINKFMYITVCFFIINSCSLQKSQTSLMDQDFEKQFFLDNRFYSTMKQKFQDKKEIIFLDSKQLITKKTLSFSNRDIKFIINNNDIIENDLFVKYYKINSDLAYIVFWTNTNEAICFIVVKESKKWIIADVIDRNIR